MSEWLSAFAASPLWRDILTPLREIIRDPFGLCLVHVDEIDAIDLITGGNAERHDARVSRASEDDKPAADFGVIEKVQLSHRQQRDLTDVARGAAASHVVPVIGRHHAVDLGHRGSGGTGDADLYVKLGSQPTSSSYTCRPYLSGSTETCTISNPGAGTWYACSYGYSAYTNVTMKGTYP